jgi:DNA-binding NtrC family response regulator
MAKILIIDDDTDICQLLDRFLKRKGHDTSYVTSGKKALTYLKENEVDIAFCDFRLPDTDGKELLLSIKELNQKTQVIIITGYSDVKIAVDVIKSGAFDYITKPLLPEEVLMLVDKAISQKDERAQLGTGSDNSASDGKVEAVPHKKHVVGDPKNLVVGRSKEAEKLHTQIKLVAPTNYSVIIYGESGTGKESVAYSIHTQSTRKDKPFIAVDCGSLTKELAGSELFGHEKGSFTSAIKQRIGKFESANGGTLFLDEIGDMSQSAQAKVLRALQENKITRVGGEKEIDVDVRVVAATNKDLLKEIEVGNFRMDLYHRLSVILIHVPPLVDRKDDITLLTQSFLDEICNEYGMPVKKISDAALDALKALPWTGNIRELRNMVERLIILSDKTITDHDVRAFANPSSPSVASGENNGAAQTDFDQFNNFQEYKDFAEREYIKFKLEKNNWNVSKTADDIDIQRSHLYSKIEKFGLKRGE